MQNAEDLLFVYGTLKRGYQRHSVLSRQRFLGRAGSVDPGRLFDCGEYPGLVLCTDGNSIKGELYSVSRQCLDACDQVEGVPEGLYARHKLLVRVLRPGVPINTWHLTEAVLEAWTYLYLLPAEHLPDCGHEWPAVNQP